MTAPVETEIRNPDVADPPCEIRVAPDRRTLTLLWSDGSSAELTASNLRDGCQSAGSKRLDIQGLSVPAPDDTCIADIATIGRYALNIAFDDGHDRGIYPWEYLRALASGGKISPAGN